jgi:CHAT domain
MIKIFKTGIKKQLGDGKLDLAMKALLPFIKKVRPDLVDDLTRISAQIALTKKMVMRNQMSFEQQNIANSNNTSAVLDFLDLLDEEDDDEGGSVSEPAAHTETPAPPTGETPPKSTAAVPSETAKYKFKLLFLGANPPGTTNIRIREEHSRITEKLADEKRQHEYLMLTEFYARASDWQEILIRDKPNIIHFSGHGTNQGLGHASDGSLDSDRLINDGTRKKQKAEEAERLKGIIMYDESMRRPQLVSTVALDDLFSLVMEEDLGIQVKAVLLNACFSEPQAIAIGKYVEYVIGTSDAVPDEAAIQFAAGFYFGMTQTMGIERAFRTGRTRALMTGLNDKNLFVLYKNGVKKEI